MFGPTLTSTVRCSRATRSRRTANAPFTVSWLPSARDDVAVDGIEPLAADAVAGVHDLGREAALLRRQRAERDRHRAGGLCGQGREAGGAGRGHAVDLERRRSRRVHGDATVSAVGTEPGPDVDGVRAGRDVGRDEGAAHAQLLLGDGLDLGDDVRAAR